MASSLQSEVDAAYSTPTAASAAASNLVAERLRRLLVAWHLCSLDASSVAVFWTWWIARSAHLTLPVSSLAAMFLAVWILYAADRLLDSRLLADPAACATDLEARHLFHFRHRGPFRLGILLAALALIPLLRTLPAQALRLYLVAGALLFAWFVLIHLAPLRGRNEPRRLPKELAVGVFFAAATFIPTVSRLPLLRPLLVVPALLLGSLCTLNCLFIFAWEHEDARHPAPLRAHPTTRIALCHLQAISGGLIILSLLLALLAHVVHLPALPPLFLAIALSAAVLLLLHRRRASVPNSHASSRTVWRAAADLALLAPLALGPFLK